MKYKYPKYGWQMNIFDMISYEESCKFEAEKLNAEKQKILERKYEKAKRKKRG